MTLSSKNLSASVILISFNDKAFLYDCLTSLHDQDLPRNEYEIIFADNGSADGSVQYVKDNFPSVQVLEFERNYGAAGGYNRAARYASGRYFVFLNVDTLLHKRWLSSMLGVMEKFPRIKACQSNMIMPWATEFSKLDRDRMPQFTYIYDLSKFGFTRYYNIPFSHELVRTLFLSGASVMVDNLLIDEIGFVFDEDLPSCPDIDLGLRINSLGYETVLVPASVLYHKNSAPMKVSPDFRTFKKMSNLIRDRFLIYFKNMSTVEFLSFLPLLIFAAPFKVREVGWSKNRQIFYGILSLPLVLYSFLKAMGSLSKFRQKREEILMKRKREKWWLLRELYKR